MPGDGGAVVDASTIAALLIPEPCTEWSRTAVAGYRVLYTTSLAPYEVYNVLWKKALRGEIGGEALPLVEELVEEFLDTVVVYELTGELRRRALEIAVEHGVTFYDAAYLALALHREAPLITCDGRFYRRLPPRLKRRVVSPEK